jgi:hypothetical protein
MANLKAPAFVRDADQRAELAALLEDTADTMSGDFGDGAGLNRAERARVAQTIARYRRWAAELAPADDAEPEAEPVQIRPATTFTETEATG